MKAPRTYQELRELERCPHIENFRTHFNDEEIENEYRPRLKVAFAKLHKLLNQSKRDRSAMWGSIYLLRLAAPIVRREDIPELVELIYTARKIRGTGAQDTENYALALLLEVTDEQLLPFWIESFDYLRPRDSLSTKRRMIAVKGAAIIALLYDNQEAYNLLLKGLRHKEPKIRQAALLAIDEIKQMGDLMLPHLLIEELQELAKKDKGLEVRQSAKTALLMKG